MLLVRNEAGLGDFVAARKAQERVLELRGSEADAADWADYALLLVYAAGGYVTPEAEAALAEIAAPRPRERLGALPLRPPPRPDRAPRPRLPLWAPLLEEAPPTRPGRLPIRDRIGEVAWLAGVDYRATAAPRPGREPTWPPPPT